MNNEVRRLNSDSGAIRSVAVPNVKIALGFVAFWHMRAAQGALGPPHTALERGSRQPTTVASTMPPVLSLRHWPSIQRQANGS